MNLALSLGWGSIDLGILESGNVIPQQYNEKEYRTVFTAPPISQSTPNERPKKKTKPRPKSMNFELLRKGRTNDWLDDDKPSASGTDSGSNKPSSTTKREKENLEKENDEDDLKKEIEELRAQISALQKSKGITPREPIPTTKTPKKKDKKTYTTKKYEFRLKC